MAFHWQVLMNNTVLLCQTLSDQLQAEVY